MAEDTELERFRALQGLVKAGASDTLLLTALRELCGPVMASKRPRTDSDFLQESSEAPIRRNPGGLTEPSDPPPASQPAAVRRLPVVSAQPKRSEIVTVRLPDGKKSSISIRPDSWSELLRRFPGEEAIKAAIHAHIKSPEFSVPTGGNLSQSVVSALLQRSPEAQQGFH